MWMKRDLLFLREIPSSHTDEVGLRAGRQLGVLFYIETRGKHAVTAVDIGVIGNVLRQAAGTLVDLDVAIQIVTTCGEYWGRMTRQMTALNKDKFNILRQRNWRCDIEPARRELGYEPHYQLKEGTKLTIQWYKENGWL